MKPLCTDPHASVRDIDVMQEVQTVFPVIRCGNGHIIRVADGVGIRDYDQGISTGAFKFDNGYVSKGPAVRYRDNGDGTGNVLEPIEHSQIVAVLESTRDGFKLCRIGAHFPLDETDMKAVGRRNAENIKARMRAAGFSEQEISTVVAAGSAKQK